MRKNVAPLIFLFISFIANSQSISNENLDKLVSNFTQKLLNRNIDTICIYESYCVGCEITVDVSKKNESCIDEADNQPIFIFWKEKGKTFINKINRCYEYLDIEITDDDFWQIYFKNSKIIEKEKIKNFESVEYKKGKKTTISIIVDHSYHQNFKFIVNNKTVSKYFDVFNLSKESDALYNINYNHNNRLISKQIIDTLEKYCRNIKESQYKIIKNR